MILECESGGNKVANRNPISKKEKGLILFLGLTTILSTVRTFIVLTNWGYNYFLFLFTNRTLFVIFYVLYPIVLVLSHFMIFFTYFYKSLEDDHRPLTHLVTIWSIVNVFMIIYHFVSLIYHHLG